MARIHVSVFGGGLFEIQHTTVYLYLVGLNVGFDNKSAKRLPNRERVRARWKKNPSILADVRIKTVEVYANRSEKNIKRGGCCFDALCTHEHIHNKSAEPSETRKKRAEKIRTNWNYKFLQVCFFLCLLHLNRPPSKHIHILFSCK